jgi:hypothetical protein
MTVADDEFAKLRTSLMQLSSALGGVLEETDDGRLRLRVHSMEIGYWTYEAGAPFVFSMRNGYFKTIAKDVQQAEMITRQVMNVSTGGEHNGESIKV